MLSSKTAPHMDADLLYVLPPLCIHTGVMVCFCLGSPELAWRRRSMSKNPFLPTRSSLHSPYVCLVTPNKEKPVVLRQILVILAPSQTSSCITIFQLSDPSRSSFLDIYLVATTLDSFFRHLWCCRIPNLREWYSGAL